MECVAYRCTEAADETRLCRRHRRRLAAGRGLPTANEQIIGDPSGRGRYGQLSITKHGILCHECGKRFISVGHHATRAHNLTAAQYRLRHGIDPGVPLALPRIPGQRRRRPRRCRCGKWFTTRAKRCPDCRAAVGIVD